MEDANLFFDGGITDRRRLKAVSKALVVKQDRARPGNGFGTNLVPVVDEFGSFHWSFTAPSILLRLLPTDRLVDFNIRHLPDKDRWQGRLPPPPNGSAPAIYGQCLQVEASLCLFAKKCRLDSLPYGEGIRCRGRCKLIHHPLASNSNRIFCERWIHCDHH